MKVEIYSKPRCSLCDKAKAVVLAVREKIPFELVEIDIRSSPDLYERYRYDIPVIQIGGERAFVHRVDPAELEARLRRELAGTSNASPGQASDRSGEPGEGNPGDPGGEQGPGL